MSWSRRGTHSLLQVRTRVLNTPDCRELRRARARRVTSPAFFSVSNKLEAITQRNLDLSIVRRCGCHTAESSRTECCTGVAKLRRIEGIEHFRTEEQPMVLAMNPERF